LSYSLVGGLIPEGEIWALGGPDVGHWRLTRQGEEVDAANFLVPPELPQLPQLEGRRGASRVHLETIPRQPTRLVPRRGSAARVDAVLLDPTELGWLMRFLRGRPWAERAFVIAGSGHSLLTAPSGLAMALPFGRPLRRLGPGGFFLEAQLELDPPLPEAARRRLFELDQGSIVALTEEGAFRFDVDRLVPAWTLWIGEGPEIQKPFDSGMLEHLGAISDRVARVADQEASTIRDVATLRLPSSRPSRAELLEQAQYAELQGDLLRAAELLEEAGETGAAGRLYERAAEGA